jgi:hypothetical protein
MKENEQTIIPLIGIASSIFQIRGCKVILDRDLAALYGTSTRALNQAVKRNLDRFPEDFMFQLTDVEKQEVVTKCDRLSSLKFSSFLPFAFTEHGALMAASVLNTKQAIQVSVFIVRAFVKMREMLSTHKEVSHRLDELERKLEGHDEAIQALISAIRELMQPPAPRKLKVGFKKES